MYCDPLLSRLQALGVGCQLGGLYVGAVMYCDDLLLLAPNRRAMVMMMEEVEKFAESSNITFSTDLEPTKSKSKVIFVCGKETRLPKPAPISLCGQLLPYVSTASHLGHKLHESGLMDHDARVKRAQYIGELVEVRETYSFASPVEVLRAADLYCSSYYGSLVWDLSSNAAKQFFNCWTTNVKLTWNLPRNTRS